MSFSDNLQYLRRDRNMTQEQLAMLLGVSRQAISRWESETAYPEMDKLVRLCDIFECTFDELIRGDVEDLPSSPARSVATGAVAVDVCGYDSHMRSRSRSLAAASVLAALGFAGAAITGGSGAMGMLTGAAIPFPAAVSICAGLIAGCAVALPAAFRHRRWIRMHPYIEDFYTEEDRALARRALRAGIGVFAASVAIGCGLAVFWSQAQNQSLGVSCFLACMAIGVWALVYGACCRGRVDVDAYNERAELAHRRDMPPRAVEACGAIMIAASAVALGALLVLGSPLFWLAWVLGALACGAIALVSRSAVGAAE